MCAAISQEKRTKREHGVRPAAGSLRGIVLGRLGTLEVRLADGKAEIEAAQRLRHGVFFGAVQGRQHGSRCLDADRFDAVCDHLLVFDTMLPGRDCDRIVGTYRLLRQEKAAILGGFYSESEFDLGGLIARHPVLNFLELGRSCVLPRYRSKRTIEVLWQGIWAYVRHFGVDVMAGCASFPGIIPAAHAQALSYLEHNCRAEANWDARAVTGRYHTMDLMPPEAINLRVAFLSLPPLIKGYLRLGARIGDGCVVDRDFGTVDVFVIMPVTQIKTRYISYYGGELRQDAA